MEPSVSPALDFTIRWIDQHFLSPLKYFLDSHVLLIAERFQRHVHAFEKLIHGGFHSNLCPSNDVGSFIAIKGNFDILKTLHGAPTNFYLHQHEKYPIIF